jgi:hypothetical protein
MASDPPPIDSYLRELRRRLPASPAAAGLVAEVEDHLRSSAAEHAGELGAEAAAGLAVIRFGPVESVARQLAGECALGLVRRACCLHAVLFGLLAVASLLTWSGIWLTGESVNWEAGMIGTFLLVQVAWTVAALTWLRAWLSRHRVRAPAGDVAVLLRGMATSAGALGLALLVRAGEKLDGGAGLTPWAGLAVLLILAAACAGTAGLAAYRVRPLRPLVAAEDPTPSDLAEQLDILAAVAARRLPRLGGALGRCVGWLDAGRHPARLLALVAAAGAAGAFQQGSMADGLWPRLATAGAPQAMAAGLALAVIETVAVTGCFALLARPLALSRRP